MRFLYVNNSELFLPVMLNIAVVIKVQSRDASRAHNNVCSDVAVKRSRTLR